MSLARQEVIISAPLAPRMEQAATDSQPTDGITRYDCAKEVAQRVARLFGDERLADVVFIVQKNEDGPEQRFVGHRNIISAWSGPLDRMLCGSFQEGSSTEVRIRDVEPAAFEAMLKLMYCGNAELTADNVLDILGVSVRFDVQPLVHFSVEFLQGHTSSEHACRMLEVGVQYGLSNLVDRCIELIVTDDHILQSEDFSRLSQTAVVELAKHDSWNMHEDGIYDTMLRWAEANSASEEERRRHLEPILEHLRYPHMSVEKLKYLSSSHEVPHELIFDAVFFKLHKSGGDDMPPMAGRYRSRPGSLLFSWVPTTKVTVSGSHRENARHTSSNGFTGVRGDRRMQHGVYSWTIDIAETQSSWIFVGVVRADDQTDVAWRATGHMLYCLDSRCFHGGQGQNHPNGDRRVYSGDCVRVVLDCTRHTLAFGINQEKPLVLFRELAPMAYVPAVDLRDCGDKVRILASNQHVHIAGASASQASPSMQIARHGVDSEAPKERRPERTVSMELLNGSDNATGNPIDLAVPSTARDATTRRNSPTSQELHLAHVHVGPPAVLQGNGHPHSAASGSNARMSQPRQSQGSQAAVSAAAPSAQDRGPVFGSAGVPLEPLALLEEERYSPWEAPIPDLRSDSVPPD